MDHVNWPYAVACGVILVIGIWMLSEAEDRSVAAYTGAVLVLASVGTFIALAFMGLVITR